MYYMMNHHEPHQRMRAAGCFSLSAKRPLSGQSGHLHRYSPSTVFIPRSTRRRPGDTIRVSLTEDPEFEAKPCIALRGRCPDMVFSCFFFVGLVHW